MSGSPIRDYTVAASLPVSATNPEAAAGALIQAIVTGHIGITVIGADGQECVVTLQPETSPGYTAC